MNKGVKKSEKDRIEIKFDKVITKEEIIKNYKDDISINESNNFLLSIKNNSDSSIYIKSINDIFIFPELMIYKPKYDTIEHEAIYDYWRNDFRKTEIKPHYSKQFINPFQRDEFDDLDSIIIVFLYENAKGLKFSSRINFVIKNRRFKQIGNVIDYPPASVVGTPNGIKK